MIEPCKTAQPPALTKDGILFSCPGCEFRLRTHDDTPWTRRTGRARWKRLDAPKEAITALRTCIVALLYEHQRLFERLTSSAGWT